MLTTLDVFNDAIATKGEAPINDEVAAATHPDYETVMRKLRTQSKLSQARGWWFNTVKFDVTPDPDNGYAVELPCGIISLKGPYDYPVGIRGTGLYDYRAGGLLTTPLTGLTAIVELDFADLPPVAQIHIAERTVLAFQREYDGDAKRTADLKVERMESYLQLNAEHIRTVKPNFLTRPSTIGRLYASAGYPVYGGRLPVR